jgi:hypothetical protein
MNLPASIYSRRTRRDNIRRPVCQQDLFMYEALVGKPAEFSTRPVQAEVAIPAGATPTPTVARRWKPNMSQVTVRLRSMYEQGLAASVKRPQVADWLKNLSEHAFSRLDEAQTRINATRRTGTDQHSAERVILTIRPEDVTDRTETTVPYKRVA